MKLHLPIKLFRAVMALFTAHALITATWADGTTPIDTESTVKTLELEADTEYSVWEGVLFPNELGTDHHIITTKEGRAPVSVSFSNASNSALHEEQITLKNLKDITFNNVVLEDVEVAIGGAMDSYALGNSVVTIENNANVTFTDNKAIVTVGGSAEGAVVRADNIYLRDNESITMTGNVSSTIDGDCIGGAMSSGGGDFELSGTKGNIAISNNSAISGSNHRALGGAILAVDMVGEGNFGGTIAISNNYGDVISITGNTVETGEDTPQYGNNEPPIYITVGGALLAMQNVEISNNTASLIDISANKATAKGSNDAYGGAIASFSGVTITYNQAATTLSAEANNRHGIVFEGNSVSSVTGSAYGGAIAASNQEFSKFGLDQETANRLLPNFVTMSNNGDITFSGNSAKAGDDAGNAVYGTAFGGGIYCYDVVSMSENGDILFNDNSATSMGGKAFGGAIYGENAVSLNNNGDITFEGNRINALNKGRGAGIYSNGEVELNENGAITFEGNTIHNQENGSAVGGAISSNFAQTSTTPIENTGVSLIGNTGDITFRNNTVTADQWTAHAGAIYSAGKLTVQDNAGNILFENNHATAKIGSDVAGGAIMTVDKMVFSGNKANISFNQNSVTSNGGNAGGGAIIGYGTGVLISDNAGSVSFTNNAVNAVSGYKTTVDRFEAGKLIIGGALVSFNTVDITGNGEVRFEGNTVTDKYLDTAINYQDADTINFSNDYSLTGGGAIFAMGNVSFSDNAGVTFNGNKVVSVRNSGVFVSGGAISTMGNVSLGGKLEFSNNSVNSSDGNISVTYGGAIHAAGIITINGAETENADTTTVKFSGNKVNAVYNGMGGAISAALHSTRDVANPDGSPNMTFGHNILLSNNKSVEFSGNTIVAGTRSRGGAIYADGHITLSNNGDILFDNNSVHSIGNGSAVGGAISTYLIRGEDTNADTVSNLPCTIFITDNTGNITFRNNRATGEEYSSTGGAIYGGRDVQITGNSGEILFEYNKASSLGASSAGGGAIVGIGGITISQNESNITFKGNETASVGSTVGGGALMSYDFGDINLTDNKGALTFDSNKVMGHGRYLVDDDNGSEFAVTDSTIGGGAIASMASVAITGNGLVTLSNNEVNDTTPTEKMDSDLYNAGAGDNGISITGGGAIMAMKGIKIDGNTGVVIEGNKVQSGAAIEGVSDNRMTGGGALATFGDVSLSHNTGDVSVKSNSVTSDTGNAMGGAIYAGNGLSIVNNSGNVTFSGNYINNSGTYQLNSIVVQGGKVELAAAAGKSISFYDSVVINTGSDMELNSYGNGQTSTGDIIFSGAQTVADLAAAKGEGSTVTNEEIAASRTSIIARNVSVAAGSLQVKDAAALLIVGTLAVNDGAKLSIGAGSTVTTGAGLTFSASAEYATTAAIAHAGTFSMKEATTTAAAEIMGNVTLTAGMTYTMDGAFTELAGEKDTLTLAASGTAHYTFNLDESLAYTQGDSKYFVLFTGAEYFVLSGVDALGDVLFDTNLTLTDAVLGYDKGSGTLYVSASQSIPEPATATLSLLALAALAARRRRR